LKICRELDDVTSAGKLFHVRAAATGNARSPTVDSRVGETSNVEVDDDLDPEIDRVGLNDRSTAIFDRLDRSTRLRRLFRLGSTRANSDRLDRLHRLVSLPHTVVYPDAVMRPL